MKWGATNAESVTPACCVCLINTACAGAPHLLLKNSSTSLNKPGAECVPSPLKTSPSVCSHHSLWPVSFCAAGDSTLEKRLMSGPHIDKGGGNDVQINLYSACHNCILSKQSQFVQLYLRWVPYFQICYLLNTLFHCVWILSVFRSKWMNVSLLLSTQSFSCGLWQLDSKRTAVLPTESDFNCGGCTREGGRVVVHMGHDEEKGFIFIYVYLIFTSIDGNFSYM